MKNSNRSEDLIKLKIYCLIHSMRQLWLIGGLLMANALSIFPQDEESMRNIAGRRYFEEIVQFVLSNGYRQTYCNMYNNNPHYSFDNIEIYLDPYNQWINCSENELSYIVSDYDEILIEDNNSEKHFRIKLVGEKIYMRDVHTDESSRLAEKILGKYLSKMISNK